MTLFAKILATVETVRRQRKLCHGRHAPALHSSGQYVVCARCGKFEP